MLTLTKIISLRFLTVLFFLSYFVIGALVFRDYGISWDERVQKDNVGMATYDYVFNNSTFLFQNTEKYYGSFFETFLVMTEKALGFTDVRDIYLLRHFLTFLLFYLSVIVFFILCKNIFEKEVWALLACLMLVICPHIFSHSFYNSKDIPFLSFFLIALTTLFFLHKKQTWQFVLLHSFSTALAVDIRVLGLLIPVSTCILLLLDLFVNKKHTYMTLRILAAYLFLSTLLVYVCWPFLWPNPVKHFAEAFWAMSKFVSYDSTVLYMGNYINPGSLPWHYIPVWMGITIPIVYIVLFFIGVFVFIPELTSNRFIDFYNQHKFILSVLFLMLVPLLAVIIFNSVLYDGWRHLFFIYPLFIIIAVNGLRYLFSFKKSLISGMVIAVLLGVNMMGIVYFMANNHPFQHVYFNFIAGNLPQVKDNFELDYWGLSYRQGLEHILKTDSAAQIKVHVANDPGLLNAMILKPGERKRIVYVNEINRADYFISNYRWHKHNYNFKEYFSVDVDGAKIMSVFKMDENLK